MENNIQLSALTSDAMIQAKAAEQDFTSESTFTFSSMQGSNDSPDQANLQNEKYKAMQILKSLQSGTNPSAELAPMILASKTDTLKSMEEDICYVANTGSSAVKFIKGEYGSGKTFHLKLAAARAMEENMAVTHIFLNKDMAMQKMNETYARVVKQLRSQNRLSFIEMLDDWIDRVMADAKKSSLLGDYAEFIIDTFRRKLSLVESASASFAMAVKCYINCRLNSNNEALSAIAGWLAGESNVGLNGVKRLAGIRGAIDKTNYLEFLRGLLRLIKVMGYRGTLLMIDECEKMMLIQTAKSRASAYDTIRDFIDYTSDGTLESTMLVFAGNAEWYDDEHCGIANYQALYDRITNRLENKFAGRFVNRRQIMLTLTNLPEIELITLMKKICCLYKTAYDYDPTPAISGMEEELAAVYKNSSALAKGKVHPRTFIRSFVELLNYLEQNQDINGSSEIVKLFKSEIERRDDTVDMYEEV